MASRILAWWADFRRKFWIWVYVEAGKRLEPMDVVEFWDYHWHRFVAFRLHQVEERYGREMVRFLTTPTDSDGQGRDCRDSDREIRIR